MNTTKDRDWLGDQRERTKRVEQFLLEYTEAGEEYHISYLTLKHHYFSWCHSIGLRRTQYAFGELLGVLKEKGLLQSSKTVLGIRMKHPIGLPQYYNVGNRKGISKRTKQAVYAKLHSNGDLCALCGRPILADDNVHIDHIFPVSAGGTNSPSNLQVVHSFCNLSKGYS